MVIGPSLIKSLISKKIFIWVTQRRGGHLPACMLIFFIKFRRDRLKPTHLNLVKSLLSPVEANRLSKTFLEMFAGTSM